MKPPTNEQIKEWATGHLCNVHGLDPDSPVLEEGFLLSRAHFVTGVLKAIEFFEGQKKTLLIAENPNAPIQKICITDSN